MVSQMFNTTLRARGVGEETKNILALPVTIQLQEM
jgi:hypothetical protein